MNSHIFSYNKKRHITLKLIKKIILSCSKTTDDCLQSYNDIMKILNETGNLQCN